MQVTNAIAWGHFQLRGGWVNVLSTTAGYAALIGLLIFGSLYLDPGSAANIYAGWTFGLMGLQIGTLILYGCWSVSSAVRKDLTSKMIESHRLMPVPATDAVAGYMIGPTSQAITIGVVNVLIGLGTIQGAGAAPLSIANWLKANTVLGIFAVSLWAMMAFLPLVFPIAPVLLFGLGFVTVLGHEVIPGLAPGVSMLIGPGFQETVFGIMATGRISKELQLSMLAQLLVAVLCYIGAVRKYRRGDVLAWGPLLGLAVLASYVLISATGLSIWERIKPLAWRMERVPFRVQLTLAAIGAFIVAVIPVAAAARQEVIWRRRRRLDDPATNPRPIPVMVISVLAALLGAALLPFSVAMRWHLTKDLPGPQLPAEQLPDVALPLGWGIRVQTVLVFFAFLSSMAYFLRLIYRREPHSKWLAGLFMAALAFVPLIVDATIHGVMTNFESDVWFTEVSGASPLVAVIYLWSQVINRETGELIGTHGGIAAQLAIAAALGLIYHLTLRRRPAADPPSPLAAAAQ